MGNGEKLFTTKTAFGLELRLTLEFRLGFKLGLGEIGFGVGIRFGESWTRKELGLELWLWRQCVMESWIWV